MSVSFSLKNYLVFYKTLGENLTQEINVFRTIKSDPGEGSSNRVDFYCCQIWFITEKGTFRTFIYGVYFIFSNFLFLPLSSVTLI